MLNFIAIALDTKSPCKEPHRLAITASEIHKSFSTNKLQTFSHKFYMSIKGRDIHRQSIPTKKRSKQTIKYPQNKNNYEKQHKQNQ